MSQKIDYKCDVCRQGFLSADDVIGFRFAGAGKSECLVVKPPKDVHHHWCKACVLLVDKFVKTIEFRKFLAMVQPNVTSTDDK